MPEPASARLGLIGPSPTDLVNQGDDIIRAIIARLEAVGARIDHGTAGSRPAASIVDRFYYATDTGVLSRDSGSAWSDLQPPDASVTATKLDDALAAKLGITRTAVRRGKTIITGAESRSNTSYGLLTTPDRVSNIVLPTDGLIAVAYEAAWENSVADAGRAAIFLNSNQLKLARMAGGSPETTEAWGGSNANNKCPLHTCPFGLVGMANANSYGGDVSTGQVLGSFGSGATTCHRIALGSTTYDLAYPAGAGGPCLIFAAAGTYDISVQFKSASGSVTVRDRKLWVWTLAF